MKTFAIYHLATPDYVCSSLTGDVYDAMAEALRLENKSGCEGWMIRETRKDGTAREYPAFLSRRAA